MFRRTVSLIAIFVIAGSSYATDRLSSWLEHMGCENLLAIHLENLLDEGDAKSRVQAARELANVYAVLLSRSSANEDISLLARANALLDKMPEAGTTELRLQLLRAAYLSAEQMIERYRLRYTNKTHADLASEQLKVIATKLERILFTLRKKSEKLNNKDSSITDKIGLASSLLGWSYYYVAFQSNSIEYANKAELVFANILQGDKAITQSVALDLKRHEQGARAILGIALVKELLQYPHTPEPWFEELEDSTAHLVVRRSVPMWRYFGDIEQGRWDEAKKSIKKVKHVDRSLLLRLAIVHALENPTDASALELATATIGELIDTGQLGMVREIVEEFGISALPTNGFIVHFIQADIAFRNAREMMQTDEPTQDDAVKHIFLQVISSLQKAIQAPDAERFPELIDDSHVVLGFCYYYLGSHSKSINSFLDGSNGDKAETATWMVLINLELLDSLTPTQQTLQAEMIALYLATWPNTKRSTQLLLYQAYNDNANVSYESLLSILPSDPSFEASQRKASRLLYEAWLNASPEEIKKIGNQYVNVAVALIHADSKKTSDKTALNRSLVRALRILEVSLHPSIQRTVAGAQSLAIINSLDEKGLLDSAEYAFEIAYRSLLLALYDNNSAEADSQMLFLLQSAEISSWTTLGTRAIWNYWNEQVLTENLALQYAVEQHILQGLSDSAFANSTYFPIAFAFAKCGFTLFATEGNEQAGEQSLATIRRVVYSHPRVKNVLKLAALIETEIGNSQNALSHWKQIGASSPVGSLDWLEAKYSMALILSTTKKDVALQVLNQHEALYPDYGQEPYGSLLRSLHADLRGTDD